MTKYEFIDDLIELFKKLDGKSDEIKKHNLDRYVEYFLLNLPVVVGKCCDETRKINQFLQRPSKYCMTCSKEMK
jgi:hypothetical protein